MDERRIAVVTGAGRREGIGFEVSRQLARQGLHVVLTARDAAAARARAEELRAEGWSVEDAVLDVAEDVSVEAFVRRLTRVDVLINNASATATYGVTPSTVSLQVARATLDTSLFGVWRLTKALLPLLQRGRSARVVNVSSGAGSHGDPAFGLTTNNAMGPAYAVAKAALNALTVVFANELRAQKILVNAVCPGFTATFPGAEAMGARPVSDGAASVVWAAMLPDEGPTGGFFRDGQPLPW